jgi:hypothetical protein
MMPSLVSGTNAKRTKFLEDLGEQLGEHGLELNEDKTLLIRFGRYFAANT